MAVYLSMYLSERSYSVANNTSVVRGVVQYKTTSTSFNRNKKPGTITVCGSSHSFSASFANHNSGYTTLAYSDFTVGHNADGTKTATGSAKYTTGVSSGTIYATASNIALTRIPRTSTLSVNKSTVAAGESITATGTKQYSGFIDTIVLKFGSHTQTLTSGTAFTIPLSWLDTIPNGTSGTATITLTTKNGSSTVGSTSKSITITTPTSVVPSISAVGVTENNNVVTTAFGNRFVQNLSKLDVSITASGIYGSTISKYASTYEGVSYNGASFTTNTLVNSGSNTLSTTITDSRSRTKTSTKSITVVPYQSPNIIGVSYIQCDASGTPNINGTYMKVTIGGNVSSVENQNNRQLVVSYKLSSATTYTDVIVPTDDWNFNVSTILPNIDATKQYNLKVSLTDKISTTIHDYVTNISQGLTLTSDKYILITDGGQVYIRYIYDTSTSWILMNTITNGIINYLGYNENYNNAVATNTGGQWCIGSMDVSYQWKSTNIESGVDTNYPIDMTEFQGGVVSLLLDTATNNNKVAIYSQTVSSLKESVTYSSKVYPLPTGDWQWIVGNDMLLCVIDTQGNVGLSSNGKDWIIKSSNLTQGESILSGYFTITATSICGVVTTESGTKILTTPITAFK